jgi:hypothetical protein
VAHRRPRRQPWCGNGWSLFESSRFVSASKCSCDCPEPVLAKIIVFSQTASFMKKTQNFRKRKREKPFSLSADYNGTYSAYMYNYEIGQVIASHEPAAATPLFLYVATQDMHGPNQVRNSPFEPFMY